MSIFQLKLKCKWKQYYYVFIVQINHTVVIALQDLTLQTKNLILLYSLFQCNAKIHAYVSSYPCKQQAIYLFILFLLILLVPGKFRA